LGSRDHSAKVFDAATGSLWTNYTRHTQTLPDREMYQHAIWAVAADPTSASVITGGEGGSLHVWQPELYRAEDGTAAQMETRFEAATHVREIGVGASDALSIACSPGRVFAGTAVGDVFAFALEDLHPLRNFECSNAPVFSLAIDPRTGTLAAGIADGRILLWQIDDDSPARTLFARP
jgi:WD40 repeat protein